MEVKGHPSDAMSGASQRLNTSSGMFGNMALARSCGVMSFQT